MKHSMLKTMMLLMYGAALIGCAPQNVRVRCDAHLQPINPPSAARPAGKTAGKASNPDRAPSGHSASGALP